MQPPADVRPDERCHDSRMLTRIDHVGLAVRDLDEAIAFYARTFDVHVVHEEVNEEQGVREAMLAVGGSGSCIQLLAPLPRTHRSRSSSTRSATGRPAGRLRRRRHRRGQRRTCVARGAPALRRAAARHRGLPGQLRAPQGRDGRAGRAGRGSAAGLTHSRRCADPAYRPRLLVSSILPGAARPYAREPAETAVKDILDAILAADTPAEDVRRPPGARALPRR